MRAAWNPGQLIFAGFPGPSIPADLAAAIAEGRVGGVVLFRRNIVSPSQLHGLIGQLQRLAPPDAPLCVCIDQEGGRVQRLVAPWTLWPPMAEVAAHNDLSATRELASAIAVELADCGVDLDFAPVADILSDPLNEVIGDRSFGCDAYDVARQVAAWIEGLQGRGVAGCAKHFPGHGDTTVDSHLDLPVVDLTVAQLQAREFVPFRAAIAADVATVMTAHVLYRSIDSRRPATMSPDVIGLLRGELGYAGLVVSDDLEMHAVAKHFDLRTRVLGPLEAGVDVLLICSADDLRVEATSRLERAPDATIESALERMVKFKADWLGRGARERGGALERDNEALALSTWRATSDLGLVTLEQALTADKAAVTSIPDSSVPRPARGGPPYPAHQALADRLRG